MTFPSLVLIFYFLVFFTGDATFSYVFFPFEAATVVVTFGRLLLLSFEDFGISSGASSSSSSSSEEEEALRFYLTITEFLPISVSSAKIKKV